MFAHVSLVGSLVEGGTNLGQPVLAVVGEQAGVAGVPVNT